MHESGRRNQGLWSLGYVTRRRSRVCVVTSGTNSLWPGQKINPARCGTWQLENSRRFTWTITRVKTKHYARINTLIEKDVILLFSQLIETRVRFTFQVLVEHSACVIKVTIKSDSTNVISGASDGCILVWEVSSGECIHKLNTHMSCITTLMFLSNEQFVVSCKI